jgi:LuxR family maltose regulon positive regulatory protein
LISAPAGFGKTTLVTEWLSRIESRNPDLKSRVAWLSLDESDNDPARFFIYLVAALQTADDSIGQNALAMAQTPQPQPIESLLVSLINDTAAIPLPLVLILDDYHLIQSLPIHQLLAFLLEHQPPHMHLLIASREDPPLPLSRWRGRGEVTEIRQADLKYTAKETADFMQKAMGLDLDSADLDNLHRLTEGWAASLQLVALSMRGVVDGHQLVQAVTGSHRYILDYLIDEVFQRLDAELQDFVLTTSILDRLTAPLCDALRYGDAVGEGGNSRELLTALERANLFLIPLDESRQWYRYHRLYRDLLRSQDNQRDLKLLHQRAARWLEENDSLEEALVHHLAAEDWEAAERVVGLAAAEAIAHGRMVSLDQWLGALPDSRLEQNWELATLKGWALLPIGQFEAAASYAQVASDLIPADAPPQERAKLICLRIYLAQAHHDLATVIALAKQAISLLEEADPHFLRGAVLGNLVQAQTAMGDIAAATETLWDMVRLSRQAGHHLSVVSALGNLASLHNLQGLRREAIILCLQALNEGVDSRGRPLPPAGQIHVVLGLVHYDGNDLELARQHLVQGLKAGEQMGPAAGGLVTGRIALALVQQAMGEDDAALATINETRQIVARFNMPQADAYVAAAEADIRLRLGHVAASVRWADLADLSPTDVPNHMSESAYLTYARLLLAQKRWPDAQTLLTNCERFARVGGRQRTLIVVHLRQAIAEKAIGDQARAIEYLEEAVRLAAPEGYRRIFLDEHQQIVELLPQVRHTAPEFVDQLLATGGWEGRPPFPRRAQDLIEPLSNRELEVLSLVIAGLTNREIAEKLFISLGTVKTHVHNIYGKLGVSNRSRAIARTRELGLI